MDESKRWTPEARERQRNAVKGWKPWTKGAGRPGPRAFAHEQLAQALMGMGRAVKA